MGYNVSIIKSTVEIPSRNMSEVLSRWKDLNKPENDHLKRGGSWDSSGRRTESRFAWMAVNYDECCDTAFHIAEMMGFEVRQIDGPGSMAIDSYDGKSGQEDLFFESIGDLVPAGQYIEWVGEDGERWRWFFDGSKMVTQQARVTYE